MMTTQPTSRAHKLSGSGWSNRILLASLFGILFLTLYPFQFNWHAGGLRTALDFLLSHAGTKPGVRGDTLNVLLFVPFGFGLSSKLWGKETARAKKFLLVVASGAFFSFGIEIIQFYVPPRDCGWNDIITNTIGTAAGFLIFAAWRGPIIRFLSRVESNLEAWLTPPHLALTLFIYFGAWFAISGLLQRETRLDNWDPDARLVIGNEASSRPAYAWKGRVLSLHLWSRALPNELARRVSVGELPDEAQVGLLGAYNFSGVTPFQDEKKSLPDLIWIPNVPSRLEPGAVELDGNTWLTSREPVSALVKGVEATQQFSVRVVCAPAGVEGTQGLIVSISRGPEAVNFNLWQRGTNLVFWFRNGISAKRSQLAWYIPDVFQINQTRDILFSYNGSDLSLYIDAQKDPRSYRLGPGAGLVQWLRRPRPSELDGYNHAFYSMIFLPAGFLLGIAGRRLGLRKFIFVVPRAAGILVFPLALELLLASVSGRPPSPHSIALSLTLFFAASFWANTDRRSPVQTK